MTAAALLSAIVGHVARELRRGRPHRAEMHVLTAHDAAARSPYVVTVSIDSETVVRVEGHRLYETIGVAINQFGEYAALAAGLEDTAAAVAGKAAANVTEGGRP